MKHGQINPSNIYYCEKLYKLGLPNGLGYLLISASHYIQCAVKNVEMRLKREGRYLSKDNNSLLNNNYHPECNATSGLDGEYSRYYSLLVRIIRWLIYMGRTGILFEASIISSFVYMPREGLMQHFSTLFLTLNYTTTLESLCTQLTLILKN